MQTIHSSLRYTKEEGLEWCTERGGTSETKALGVSQPNSQMRAVARSAKKDGSPLVVVYSIDGKAAETKILAPSVDDRGDTTFTLSFDSSMEMHTLRIYSLKLSDDKGVPLVDIRGEGAGAAMELSFPDAESILYLEATTLDRSSKYVTWISSDPNGTKSHTTSCEDSFQFRIQKRRVHKNRSKGKTSTQVSWTTLPKKYTARNKNGTMYYRTVDLKKGTYRSVVYGKCDLIGGTTRQVTIKR